MDRGLAASIAVYVAGSVIDNLTTYWFVVVTGRFAEANRLVDWFIRSQPLYLWFARDLGFLALLTACLIAYRRLVLALASEKPGNEKLAKIAGRYWLPLLSTAILRAVPAAHNLLLAGLGVETPIPKLLYH